MTNPAQSLLLSRIEQRIAESWSGLPDKPEETPMSVARALWFAAAGKHCSTAKALVTPLPPLPEGQELFLEKLVAQRLSGTPVAHLTGMQNFMGIEFKTGPQALIPRKETEILGYAALDRLSRVVAAKGSARVFDICTGSGNLAIAMALHVPFCRIFAADISPEVISLATSNAEYLGVTNQVEFHTGDLFEPFSRGNFDHSIDVILCNPPYLSSTKAKALPPEISIYEPAAAFDGGALGVAIISRLINEAPRFLNQNGWLCFEVGLGTGDFLRSRLQRVGAYKVIEAALDPSGHIRALLAQV